MSALRERDDRVAHLEAVGREDVRFSPSSVVEERDARRAVRIVLDRRDLGRHADLVALEVDDAVALLVTAAPEARGDAAVVVAASRVGLVLGELLDDGARCRRAFLKSATS